MGPSMVNDNLEPLLRVLPVTWRYLPLGPSRWFMRQLLNIRNRSKELGDIVYTVSETDQQEKRSELYVYMALSDPSNIPALKQLIERSLYKVDRSSESTAQDARYLPLSRRRSGPTGIRPELRIMVLDCLSEPLDVYNAVAAFGWEIPGTYGRSRFPSELIPELNGIPSELINWTTLFTVLGELLRSPPLGFENRKRIIEIVYAVQDQFHFSYGDCPKNIKAKAIGG